ncbi:MAG: recombinase family protein [Patescibacteria group bacterium]|nr:recombinase family protein [Patescibacteria group bacterium]
MSPKTGARVVLYCRVSSDEQAASGLGLEAQEAKGRQYAALYGLDLVDVVIDAGISAKSLKRPGLQATLARMDAGEIDGILVAKLDRLTRSVKDLGTLIDRYFSERAGYRLLAVEDQVDTKSAGGRLVLNVLASVSQWEREVIGERTRDALGAKKARGERVGNIPLGYRLSSDGRTLEPDPGESRAVERILSLRALGMSCGKIASTLTSEGIPARSGRWHPEQVRRVAERAT